MCFLVIDCREIDKSLRNNLCLFKSYNDLF